MNTPLFSIVVPVYNRSECAKLFVESLRCQSEVRWEALLVDDGSDAADVEAWRRETVGDSRFVHYIREREPKGAPTSRNIGMSRASGDYVIFLDCDDALREADCLAERASAMEEHTECDFVVSPTEVFRDVPGDIEKVWNIGKVEPDLDRFLRLDIPWQTAGPTWRRSALARVGLWDESLPGRQDWEFHIRAICRKMIYTKIDDGWSLWRLTRPGSVSSTLSDPSRIKPALAVLDGMIGLLEESGLMTPRRRRLLAMQHVAMGMVRARCGDFDAARTFVALAVERGLLPGKYAKAMTAYTCSARVPLASKVVQLGLAPFIPKDCFVPWWTDQLRRSTSDWRVTAHRASIIR